MMYKYADIRELHLEPTDKCNASCPMCARNKNGGEVNPHLPLTELNLKDCQTIFPERFVKQLDTMFMCGNYGDPAVATNCLEIFEWFRILNPNIFLSMHTNGSLRTSDWWKDLGSIIGRKGNITFSIDGLANTNHIYRRGTDFEKIMANARAVIESGSRARWAFLVFGHNEHQIDQARQMAEEIGFESFTPKKSGRFFSNVRMAVRGSREVWNRNGEVEYEIYPPSNPEWQNQALQKDEELIQKYGSLKEYLNHACVECKVAKTKSIYVNSEALVFPCCWTANQLHTWWREYGTGEIWNMINASGGRDEIDGRKRPLVEIVEGSFFRNIQDSWAEASIEEGKLTVCSKTCGVDFDPYSEQFK